MGKVAGNYLSMEKHNVSIFYTSSYMHKKNELYQHYWFLYFVFTICPFPKFISSFLFLWGTIAQPIEFIFLLFTVFHTLTFLWSLIYWIAIILLTFVVGFPGGAHDANVLSLMVLWVIKFSESLKKTMGMENS